MIRFIVLSILFFSITACLKEEEVFISDLDIVPISIDDGWEIVSPNEVQIDPTLLEEVYSRIHDEASLPQLRSLLVFRNEKLVSEFYFKSPTDIITPRPVWSCTKQIIGLLTGKAIEEGVIRDVSDKMDKYLTAEIAPYQDKRPITIEHLLTMRSGIDFDETKDVAALLRKEPMNVIDFILSKPLLFNPGDRFRYNSGETHLLAASIQNAVD